MYQISYKNSDRKPLWLVSASYIMGSSSKCDIYIDDANLSDEHVRFDIEDSQVLLTKLTAGAKLSVNGQSVLKKVELHHGDSFNISGIEFELSDPKVSRLTASSSSKKSDLMEGWSLKALSSALAHRKFVLAQESIIGRAEECDIALDVAHLSRRHAKFSIRQNNLMLEDLGSSNGSYVNGSKITSSVMLKPGDELRFDSLKFIVEGPELKVKPAKKNQLDSKTVMRPVLKIADEKMLKSAHDNTGVAGSNTSMSRSIDETKPKHTPKKTVVVESVTNASSDTPNNNAFIAAGIILIGVIVGLVYWFLA